jgi:ABC-type transporter Mla subunit MlaD
METKANYVLIGAATIIGVILILLFATWITTGDLRRGFNE